MQYANFMPGESLPERDLGLLRSIYDHGEAIGCAVGVPDLLPRRPYQQAHAYKLMKEKKEAGKLIVGIAVQDGNYRGETGSPRPPAPGEEWPDTVPDLAANATEILGARSVFWRIEEPYFSGNVLPWLATREKERDRAAEKTADANDDGRLDVADAVAILAHLFQGRGLFPTPGSFCGVDETEDTLGCEGQSACSAA